MLLSLLILSTAALPPVQAEVEPSFGAIEIPAPATKTLTEWLAAIEPTEEEARFEAIPWRSTFGAGLEAASESGRPMLLWVMNGHPLGCT